MGEIRQEEIGVIIDDLIDEAKKTAEAKRDFQNQEEIGVIIDDLIKVNQHLRKFSRSQSFTKQTLNWATAHIRLMAKNIKFKNLLTKLFDNSDPDKPGIVLACGTRTNENRFLFLDRDLKVILCWESSRIETETGDYYPRTHKLNAYYYNFSIALALMKLTSEDPVTRVRFFFDKLPK